MKKIIGLVAAVVSVNALAYSDKDVAQAAVSMFQKNSAACEEKLLTETEEGKRLVNKTAKEADLLKLKVLRFECSEKAGLERDRIILGNIQKTALNSLGSAKDKQAELNSLFNKTGLRSAYFVDGKEVARSSTGVEVISAGLAKIDVPGKAKDLQEGDAVAGIWAYQPELAMGVPTADKWFSNINYEYLITKKGNQVIVSFTPSDLNFQHLSPKREAK